MSATWLSRMLAFDTETTGVDVFTDRIVTASAIRLGASGVLATRSWLLNPGVEIPAEAAGIHGITTQKAQAEGADPAKYLPQIADELREMWAEGHAVIAMNASFDLTILQAELQRYGCAPLEIGPVIDPLVLDRMHDPYRPGKRNLETLAQVYGVKLEGAHTSDGDALAAARVVWAMAKGLKGLAQMSLADLQGYQASGHAAWAAGFEQYLRRKDPTAKIEREWPVRRCA